MNHNINLLSFTPFFSYAVFFHPSHPKNKPSTVRTEQDLDDFCIHRIESSRFKKANIDTKWHKNSVKGGKAIMMNQTNENPQSHFAMALLKCIPEKFMSHFNKKVENSTCKTNNTTIKLQSFRLFL